jgi:hypothetical protein
METAGRFILAILSEKGTFPKVPPFKKRGGSPEYHPA